MNPPKRKSPAHCSRTAKLHTKTVRRWLKRKKKESADRNAQFLSDLDSFGSVRNLSLNKARAMKARKDKLKAEFAMLATTSLKDLIK